MNTNWIWSLLAESNNWEFFWRSGIWIWNIIGHMYYLVGELLGWFKCLKLVIMFMLCLWLHRYKWSLSKSNLITRNYVMGLKLFKNQSMCDISADIKTNSIHHFFETLGKIIYQLITKTKMLTWHECWLIATLNFGCRVLKPRQGASICQLWECCLI